MARRAWEIADLEKWETRREAGGEGNRLKFLPNRTRRRD
jgi:hypothetical protein